MVGSRTEVLRIKCLMLVRDLELEPDSSAGRCRWDECDSKGTRWLLFVNREGGRGKRGPLGS